MAMSNNYEHGFKKLCAVLLILALVLTNVNGQCNNCNTCDGVTCT